MKAYDVITDRIVSELQKGTIPWRKPWGGPDQEPRNLQSRKPYRGVNVFLLGCQGFESPYWVTFKQAQGMGGHVRKGEHGSPVVFWKWLEKRDAETGELKRVPMLRYYTTFNVEQTEGIPYPKPELRTFCPIQEAEGIVASYPNAPAVEHGGGRAFYVPSRDRIKLPLRESFHSDAEYYSTLFHEMGHSTGHASRLNRKTLTDAAMFGDHNYSREELVAEMTAAFLCGCSGIEQSTLENSAAYLRGWVRVLRGEARLVVQAAAHSIGGTA